MSFCLRSVLRNTPLVGPSEAGLQTGNRELSLLSSVITYDGLSVAREWLGRAVGLGRAPRGAPDVHRTSAVT